MIIFHICCRHISQNIRTYEIFRLAFEQRCDRMTIVDATFSGRGFLSHINGARIIRDDTAHSNLAILSMPLPSMLLPAAFRRDYAMPLISHRAASALQSRRQWLIDAGCFFDERLDLLLIYHTQMLHRALSHTLIFSPFSAPPQLADKTPTLPPILSCRLPKRSSQAH